MMCGVGSLPIFSNVGWIYTRIGGVLGMRRGGYLGHGVWKRGWDVGSGVRMERCGCSTPPQPFRQHYQCSTILIYSPSILSD